MESTVAEQILDYLCNELGGDWFLSGGGLVRLSFDASRGTEDLDIVRMSHPDLSDEAAKTALFRWLIERGLGPEWVNSALEPFVREVSGWEKEVLEIRKGTRGRLFRPCLTLFVYLKLRRGTEVDLADIAKAVPKCPEGFDEKKFRSWADAKTLERFQRHRGRFPL